MFSQAISSIKSATGIENPVLAAVPGLAIATGSLSVRAVMAGIGYCCKGAAKYTPNEQYANQLADNLIKTSKSNIARDMKFATAVTVIGVAGVKINNHVTSLNNYEYVVSTVKGISVIDKVYEKIIKVGFLKSGIQGFQSTRQSVQEKLPSIVNIVINEGASTIYDGTDMVISIVYWKCIPKLTSIGDNLLYSLKHPFVCLALITYNVVFRK